MTDVIATFKLNNFSDDDGISNEEMNDILVEIAEKGDMQLISWGTI